MDSLIISHLKTGSKASSIFLQHIEKIEVYGLLPHQFVEFMEDAWDSLNPKPDRGVHGTYFEYVIGETLAQRGVRYLYHQAIVRHVPLAVFDWFLYHEMSPVSISCKVSARERWKQAAMEAMALKQVYKQSVNYLVTIERLAKADEKLKLSPYALDQYVIANKPEYDDMVDEIVQRSYMEAVDVSPIFSGKLVAVGDTGD